MRGLALFAIALLSAGAVVDLPQVAQPLPGEQTQFSAEDEAVKRPVAIPDDVMGLLAQDPYVHRRMLHEDSPLKQPPASWYSASVTHLAGPDEKDLVVEAEGELAGANVTNFWIFRQLPGGAQLVLNGPAHDLTIMRSRWNGLREIELESATATKFHRVVLRFDGARYTAFSDKWEDIR